MDELYGRNMKIVEVAWLDIWSESAELTEKGLTTMVPVPRRTYGLLKVETDTEVVISSNVTEWSKIGKGEDGFNDNITIPKVVFTQPMRELG